MTEIFVEEEKKPIKLLMKNVRYDSTRHYYTGEAVGDVKYAEFTREMVDSRDDLQYLSTEREMWKVKPISRHYCSNCVSEAMYDEKDEKYYCPKCE